MRKEWRVGLFLLLAAGGFGAGAAGAARLYVDGSVAVSGDGSSWAAATKTIGEAIAAAHFGDEIWVAEGTYGESIALISGVTLYGGFAKTEASPAERDLAAHPTIIDGSAARGGLPAYHVVDMNGNTGIDGFTIRGGEANGAGADAYGGGIHGHGAARLVTVANCTITSNSASYGGGILCRGKVHLSVSHCTIAGNTGHGIRRWGSGEETADTSITDCVLSGNRGPNGAGIWCDDGSIRIAHCFITGNSAPSVAAYLRSVSIEDCTISGDMGLGIGDCGNTSLTSCTVTNSLFGACITGTRATVVNCLFQGNEGIGLECSSRAEVLISDSTISDNRGDGVWAMESDLSMDRCAVRRNSLKGIYIVASEARVNRCAVSDNDGGGVHCSNASPVISDCVISGNAAAQGSGVCCYNGYAPSSPRITNTVISENAASKKGGGLYADLSSTFTLVNCTISGNSAGEEGGGVFSGAWCSPTIVNTIFEGNAKHAVSAASTSSANVDHCLFHGNPDGDYLWNLAVYTGAEEINSHVPNAANNIGGDPKFVSKAAGDFHLQDGSQALDRGDVASAPPADFEGDPRPGEDALVDIGADEAPAAFAPADLVAPESHALALPRMTTASVLGVSFECFDADGGVQYVELFYRKDGGAWTLYPGSYSASPISFDSAVTGGPGRYDFYTVATDNASNVEEPPLAADATTLVAAPPPTARVYVNCNASGPQTGADWNSPLHEIGSALDVAQMFGATEVWVAQGTYEESIAMISGVALYGGFAGTESTLEERNVSLYPTVIDASHANAGKAAEHAVVMNGVTNARIDGFTITGGAARSSIAAAKGGGVYCVGVDASNVIANCFITANAAWREETSGSGEDWRQAAYGEGGGIYCVNSALSIVDCTIDSNAAAGYGGGICCVDSPIAITDCAITRNHGWSYFQDFQDIRTKGSGGGIHIHGDAPSIRRCTIRGNETSDEGGGVCYGRSTSAANIFDCIISENVARGQSVWLGDAWGSGGGIYCYGCSAAIVGCSIQSNEAIRRGGGVCADYAPYISLADCAIDGNVVTGVSPYGDNGGDGGGIYCWNSSASIVRCSIRNNTTYTAGGGLCGDDSSFSILNALISGNSANQGGALAIPAESHSHSTLSMTNCTVRGNTADSGGGLMCEDGSAAVIRNTLFEGNAHYAIFEAAAGADASPAYCLFHNNADGDYFDENSLSLSGADDINAHVAGAADNVDGDPRLAADGHLNYGSAAIDTGGAVGAPADDLEGNPRPVDIPGFGADGTGTEFDIGAYEFQGIQLIPPVQDIGGGRVGLQWLNTIDAPFQFLGFAWDIYQDQWVEGGWNGTLWHPFAATETSGTLELALSGAYHVWISSQWAGGWLCCSNPWTGILYSGTPHTPLDVSAGDLELRRVRLQWKPEIYGTWHYQIIAYKIGQGWILTEGPDGLGLWHFIPYPNQEFLSGSAEFGVPSAGDYWFFIRAVSWLPPYPAGEWGAAFVTVP